MTRLHLPTPAAVLGTIVFLLVTLLIVPQGIVLAGGPPYGVPSGVPWWFAGSRSYAEPPRPPQARPPVTAAPQKYQVTVIASPPVLPPAGPGPLAPGVTSVSPSAPPDTSARIDLQVPQGAEVWFDGEKTTQTGNVRRFVTPPLKPGHKYAYEVRVIWNDGAGEATETRRLSLGAGDSLNELFPTATARSGSGGSQRSGLPSETGK